MIDIVTKAVADYIKGEEISIDELSKNTDISGDSLSNSLIKLTRPLKANEFLAICAFLEKDPNDFKRNVYKR